MPLSEIMRSHIKRKSHSSGQQGMLDAFIAENPSARTLRWRQTVKLSFAEMEDVAALADDFREMLVSVKYVPDAYIINTDENYLHFFEVEVYSPMSPQKLQAYGKMAIDMAFYGIDFAVYTINQHGDIHVVDLLPHYADWLKGATQCLN